MVVRHTYRGVGAKVCGGPEHSKLTVRAVRVRALSALLGSN